MSQDHILWDDGQDIIWDSGEAIIWDDDDGSTSGVDTLSQTYDSVTALSAARAPLTGHSSRNR